MAEKPAQHMEGELDIAVAPEGSCCKGGGLQVLPEGTRFHWPGRYGTVYPRVQ